MWWDIACAHMPYFCKSGHKFVCIYLFVYTVSYYEFLRNSVFHSYTYRLFVHGVLSAYQRDFQNNNHIVYIKEGEGKGKS